LGKSIFAELATEESIHPALFTK